MYTVLYLNLDKPDNRIGKLHHPMLESGLSKKSSLASLARIFISLNLIIFNIIFPNPERISYWEEW